MSSNVVPFTRDGENKIFLNAGDSHARFYSDWRHLDAFKTLTPLQRVILQDILMSYSKQTGNEVRMTGHEIARRHKVGHRTASSAIGGLEERGWIVRIGQSPGPTGQSGGLYEILCISPNGARTAGPYQRWQPTRSNKRNR